MPENMQFEWIIILRFFLNHTGASKKLRITEAEVENLIQFWLKYSSDREGGRKRRAEKKRCKSSYRKNMESYFSQTRSFSFNMAS